MTRKLLLAIFLSSASVTHADTFTIKVSSANATKIYEALGCSGTPTQKTKCATLKIKEWITSRVINWESQQKFDKTSMFQ